MRIVLVVHEEEKGQRLDRFLVNKIGGGLTRAQLQKQIKCGTWRVQGKIVSSHYAVKEGEVVEAEEGTVKRGAISPGRQNGIQSIGEESALASKLKHEGVIKIIHTTDEYLIIDKPSGIAVHPTLGIRERTIVDMLIMRFPELRTVGEDPMRPGIVHRLDKDVSGVMVVARTQAAFKHLKKQFQERKVEKQYSAMVYGTFVNDEGRIELPLKRRETKKKHGTMKVLPKGTDAIKGVRYALTDFTVMRRFPRMTLVSVFPHTGRTHQIRAHFAGIGHPIVGDSLYHSRRVRKVNVVLDRPFLHASSIAFIDREGNKHAYQSPLPGELDKILNESV